EWGEVKRFTGWQPLPLIAEREGDIVAAMLVLKRRLPVPGLKKCIFYAPRGPVADIADAEALAALFAGARALGREHGAIFLKIDPDVPVSQRGLPELLIANGFHRNDTGLDFEGVQPAFVFRLDITPSEEELLAAMHQKTRYNIRLAQRKGVVIREAAGRGELPVFYAILEETAQRDHFLIRGYEYFEKIWDEMVPPGMAKFFMAEYEGEVIAATLAFILGDKAWYSYGASSNRQRNLMPNYLIQWEMICRAKQLGATLYDFRGVSGDLNEDNPLYGLYRFKKGFNGELTEFIGDWDCVYAPAFYKLWNMVLPRYMAYTHRGGGTTE
ncbi:MAG: peptidoglycan bridge formation glycyltransferase FemA/FemB family protein, partial [Syntrophomonadaceae bacterium]|nr:peptidoglycan bridge formation glycyltransferase FemA/FemB family protein [Syntrophomonadaceae bacterium]